MYKLAQRMLLCSGLLLGLSLLSLEAKEPHGFASVYDRYREVLVSIEDPSQRNHGNRLLGSGVVISEDGYLLTSNKAVEKFTRVIISNRAKNLFFSADVVGRDRDTDVALLKIKSERPMKYAAFDVGRKMRAGEMVLMLSNEEDQAILSALVVSEGLQALVLDRQSYNLGAAVVDTQGNLIGMAGGKQLNSHFTVSADAKTITEASRQLVFEDRVLRAYFGMTADNLEPSLYGFYGIKRGVLVTGVENNGSAERAGLMRGDLIIGVGSESVDAKAGFAKTVSEYAEEDNVTIRFIRNRLNKSLQMRLSKINRELLNPGAFWYKGMVLEELSPKWREVYNIPGYLKGVVVTLIEPASPAQAGGMRQGDVIYQLETKSIGDLAEYKALVNKNKKERMFIYRDGWNFIKLF